MKKNKFIIIFILMGLISFIYLFECNCIEIVIINNDCLNDGNTASLNTLHPSNTSGVSGFSESFIIPDNNIDFILTKMSFYINKAAGYPSFAVASLYNSTSNNLTIAIPDSEVAISEPIDFTNYPVIGTIQNFTFNDNYTLISNTVYFATIRSYNGTWNSSNYIYVRYKNTGNIFDGYLYRFRYSNFELWGATSSDLPFYVYGEPILDLGGYTESDLDNYFIIGVILTILGCFILIPIMFGRNKKK